MWFPGIVVPGALAASKSLEKAVRLAAIAHHGGAALPFACGYLTSERLQFDGESASSSTSSFSDGAAFVRGPASSGSDAALLQDNDNAVVEQLDVIDRAPQVLEIVPDGAAASREPVPREVGEVDATFSSADGSSDPAASTSSLSSKSRMLREERAIGTIVHGKEDEVAVVRRSTGAVTVSTSGAEVVEIAEAAADEEQDHDEAASSIRSAPGGRGGRVDGTATARNETSLDVALGGGTQEAADDHYAVTTETAVRLPRPDPVAAAALGRRNDRLTFEERRKMNLTDNPGPRDVSRSSSAAASELEVDSLQRWAPVNCWDDESGKKMVVRESDKGEHSTFVDNFFRSGPHGHCVRSSVDALAQLSGFEFLGITTSYAHPSEDCAGHDNRRIYIGHNDMLTSSGCVGAERVPVSPREGGEKW
eukprot:CAMPEP_0178988214 /NCGR_PEP_ID=MMETSP0795-20121207/3692_1 /TAXON_ID=88552 /ORGANISM="Amoebophrya sp., Strain Ameob2" /LENGTH=420 /DNA_ID=CAMNT_0020679475 /DNA_START=224 /DNA_END=1483 /DNA_ORIENTATION=+